MTSLPTWNLKDFYQSIKDKKIEADLKSIEKSAQSFAKKYRGKIVKLKSEEIAKAISQYEEISEKIGEIGSYAYLVYASDLGNKEILSFYQNTSECLNKYQTHLVFLTIELNEISDKDLQNHIKQNPTLKKYQPFFRDIRVFKKYQLEEKLEKFSLEKNISGRSAWIRLFDETVNNLQFEYDSKVLNSSQIFDLMQNKDEKIRKKAAKSIGKTLQDNSKIFAYITNILAKDKEIDDNWRGFKTPIQSRNLSNFVDDKIVETLIKKVKANYKETSHRYYKIKAKFLGKKYLNYWDRNAPLSQNDEKISWEEAKSLVLSSYQEFSPQMAKIAKEFFDKKWIDAQVRNGKDSGAFSHPTTPSKHPYILMNYQGKVRDVMTLAHELGHGIHQYLARKQGYLMAETPLTLAETASVFGEQLTFQNILKREKNAAKKKLIIMNKIEDMLNTVVRQIAFLEFERKIHSERKKGEISLEKICEFWMEVQKESLGDVFKYDEEYKYFWSYIPHFIHSPFYVYSYAFGDCLVNSLYGVYKNGKVKNFPEKYIEMLTAGGIHHHKELLAPFGLDASKADFWQQGLDVIRSYVEMVK